MTEPQTTTERAPSDRYLPALPDGWTWGVTALGPDGTSVDITPNFVSDGQGGARQLHGYDVVRDGRDGEAVHAGTLREATEKVVAAAKALERAAEARRALDAAERAAERALRPAPDPVRADG